LFLFDKKSGKLASEYRVVEGQSASYVFNVNGIDILNDSTLALGTTEGLYAFDIRKKKGWPLQTSVDVKMRRHRGAIHLDTKGNILFSHLTGIGKYNMKTRRVSLFGSEEWVDIITYGGLHENTFRDGRLFVGVKNHFAVFHPDRLPDAQPPPAPRITRLLLHNCDLPEALWRHGLELRYDSNFITFHFSTLRFFEPAVQFRYRLLGLHEAWSEMQSERIATYTSLLPGHYVFQVQAISQEGMDSPVTSLAFRIRPPWYATWWFRTLLALAFVGLIYAVFRYREIRRLEQEKLRLRISRDLHDEMGSTLSSISILSEAALRNLQADIDRARFGAIGERARQVMEAMSDIVWSVNPRNDNMENVLLRMKEFAVEILEPQEIALHFEADEAVKTLNLPMEQRKDFYLLFKEAVNNAAKYSGASDVWVNVQSENGGLLLEVRDNGRGFDPAQVKRGNGLWNMEQRAERMGAKFGLESKAGAGTALLVKL
jgi:signal transduction histidine kinase